MTAHTLFHIDSLPPESADVLLHGLLGGDATLQPLRALLIPRTGGNPFFLEESVRTLVETGVLIGERGAYHLAEEARSIQIPDTVQAVLAARIDRLPPEEKRLLQCAAAVGKEVPFSVLSAIADGPESEVRRRVVNLQAAEFLYEARLFPDLEYVFKHALTQEVAYAGLTSDRRRALDTGIIGILEQTAVERADEHVERLAHHAFRGESWAKAATYLQQAGAKALTRSAYRQAAVDLERALVALAHQPERRETLEQFVDIKVSLRGSLQILGDLDAALVQQDRSPLPRSPGTRRGARHAPLVARCHAGLANLYRRTGQHQQARELLTTATTMYREMGMRFWLNEAEVDLKVLE